MMTDREARDIAADKHTNDNAEFQYVPSHPVCPDRTIAVTAVSPTPAPCTVTDADPVPARLYPSITLITPASIDITAVPLPDRSPAVIVPRRVP